ncbi:MFS general substrate transporter [Piedraia hortae CBS 480.64]|uniref:MFS general substrate transporter n=1 Tax=Piedraia hortae CBS 480.64 TaxID=1314780 RepID=A0A6A7BS65_9PEZI|nr:MFS general substrate transporter [Piedraia hortae CBS 480.64]
MRDYGLAAPHGPNLTGGHVATASLADMSPGEESGFRQILQPNDSYDETGTYWADMGLMRRAKFTTKVDSKEAAAELRSIGQMMKRDPLSPVSYYFRNMVLPGMGLLLEGYVLFSIGILESLYKAAYPECWDKHKVCDKQWTQAVVYMEIVGIMVGQILVGFVGDWMGRRWGLIQDAVIMFLGLILLISAWASTLQGWVIFYAWALFFYSIGVGGEYPMTATSGMENAVGSGKISTREDRLHRGRKVVSAFLMQGWAQLLNQAVLIILLLIFNHGGSPPYSRQTVQLTYRVSFAFPAIGTLWLIYYRTWKMKSASKQLEIAKRKQHVTGYDATSLKLVFTKFGGRVIATAFAWFANDVFFYGNKLFQAQFIAALYPGSHSVMVSWSWNMVNCVVSLAGYYLASFLIDNKLYGRKWMQMVGFLGDFICFIIPAYNYDYYAKGPGVHSFMAMYFISSFFNQFGPNCVSFLVAAEVFPTPVRATAHGFGAAAGKAGALLAAVLYNYIDIRMRYKVVPWFGLAGALVTWIWLPDTTGLDLKEQERRWNYIRQGREKEYHGVAVHPKHLSLWERMRGVGKQYNPQLDYEQRLEELRGDWEESMRRRAQEKGAFEEDGEDDWSSEVSQFFERTRNVHPQGRSVMSDEKVE